MSNLITRNGMKLNIWETIIAIILIVVAIYTAYELRSQPLIDTPNDNISTQIEVPEGFVGGKIDNSFWLPEEISITTIEDNDVMPTTLPVYSVIEQDPFTTALDAVAGLKGTMVRGEVVDDKSVYLIYSNGNEYQLTVDNYGRYAIELIVENQSEIQRYFLLDEDLASKFYNHFISYYGKNFDLEDSEFEYRYEYVNDVRYIRGIYIKKPKGTTFIQGLLDNHEYAYVEFGDVGDIFYFEDNRCQLQLEEQYPIMSVDNAIKLYDQGVTYNYDGYEHNTTFNNNVAVWIDYVYDIEKRILQPVYMFNNKFAVDYIKTITIVPVVNGEVFSSNMFDVDEDDLLEVQQHILANDASKDFPVSLSPLNNKEVGGEVVTVYRAENMLDSAVLVDIATRLEMELIENPSTRERLLADELLEPANSSIVHYIGRDDVVYYFVEILDYGRVKLVKNETYVNITPTQIAQFSENFIAENEQMFDDVYYEVYDQTVFMYENYSTQQEQIVNSGEYICVKFSEDGSVNYIYYNMLTKEDTGHNITLMTKQEVLAQISLGNYINISAISIASSPQSITVSYSLVEDISLYIPVYYVDYGSGRYIVVLGVSDIDIQLLLNQSELMDTQYKIDSFSIYQDYLYEFEQGDLVYEYDIIMGDQTVILKVSEIFDLNNIAIHSSVYQMENGRQYSVSVDDYGRYTMELIGSSKSVFDRNEIQVFVDRLVNKYDNELGLSKMQIIYDEVFINDTSYCKGVYIVADNEGNYEQQLLSNQQYYYIEFDITGEISYFKSNAIQKMAIDNSSIVLNEVLAYRQYINREGYLATGTNYVPYGDEFEVRVSYLQDQQSNKLVPFYVVWYEGEPLSYIEVSTQSKYQ